MFGVYFRNFQRPLSKRFRWNTQAHMKFTWICRKKNWKRTLNSIQKYKFFVRKWLRFQITTDDHKLCLSSERAFPWISIYTATVFFRANRRSFCLKKWASADPCGDNKCNWVLGLPHCKSLIKSSFALPSLSCSARGMWMSVCMYAVCVSAWPKGWLAVLISSIVLRFCHSSSSLWRKT